MPVSSRACDSPVKSSISHHSNVRKVCKAKAALTVKLLHCTCSMQEKGYSGDDSYALSKLASMMFTYDLAEFMKPKGVTVNCLDPGTVNTKLLIAGWGACGIDIKVITAPAPSADRPSVLADKPM